jgi:hypothetical protein
MAGRLGAGRLDGLLAEGRLGAGRLEGLLDGLLAGLLDGLLGAGRLDGRLTEGRDAAAGFEKLWPPEGLAAAPRAPLVAVRSAVPRASTE